MIGKPGPFQIIDAEAEQASDFPIEAPRRRHDCAYYGTCLNVATVLNWDNFTCRGCSGKIDQALVWHARQQLKKDPIASKLCELPSIPTLAAGEEEVVSAVGFNDHAGKILQFIPKRRRSGGE